MHFALTEEISEEILDKAKYITEISNNLKNYFKNRNYGLDVDSFYIGIICVSPLFDSFFKVRKLKYIKSKKEISFDIKLDYSNFRNIENQNIKSLILTHVINSLDNIYELNLEKFDIKALKYDLEKYS